MTFSSYLRGALTGAALTGLALGIILVALVLSGLRVTGDITLDLEFGVLDGFWSVLALPLLLCVLTLFAAPVVYVLMLFANLVRKRRRES